MTDYVSLHRELQNMQAGDRLVLSEQHDGDVTSKVLSSSSEHKRKFAIFNSARQANDRISRENLEASRTVRQALVARYGEEGKAIFKKVFGEVSGKDVTAGKLRKMFAMGRELERQTCRTLFRQSFLAEESRNRKIYEKNTLTRLGLAPGRVGDLKVRAQLLLHQTPSSAPELQEHNALLQRHLAKVDSLKAEIEQRLQEQANHPVIASLSDRIRSQVIGDLDSIREALSARIEANNGQIRSNPFRVDNVRGGFEVMFDGAIVAANELALRYENLGQPMPRELREFFNRITQERSLLFTRPGPDGVRVPRPDDSLVTLDELKTMKTVQSRIKKELGDLCKLARPPLMTKDEMKHFYREARVEALNRSSWGVISRQISVSGYTKPATLTSTIVPAKHLALTGSKMPEVNGVSSMDTRSAHSCTLAVTSLSDSQGNRLFTGIRHGVCCAFGIESQDERRQANATKAKEVVLAALESRPDLLAQARSGRTVTLPMVSTSLLTPSDGVNSKERLYLNEQLAAWRDICDQNGVCRIEVPDGNGGTTMLHIRPQLTTFNFGVNFFSHTKIGHLITLGGGWSNSNRLNRQAFADFSQAVRDHLANGNLSEKDRRGISTLLDQARQLFEGNAYSTGGVNPFALPARIAVLAYKCGFVPCFNCKSGKDRTSQMDAEIKTILAQIEVGATPLITPDDAQKTLTKNMLFNAGNLEIQRYNTGVAGYKLQHVSSNTLKDWIINVPSLASLFSSEREVEQFLGGGLIVPS